MTSNQHASNDVRAIDGTAPLQRHTTSNSHSSSTNRFSFASSDTAESSTAVSKRNSRATTPLQDGIDGKNGGLDVAKPVNGRGSQRSHRSKNSGGFLLSSTTFDPPSTIPPATAPQRSSSQRDHKGKAALRAPEKKHTRRRSAVGLGIGGSPLAANVTTVTSNGVGGDSTADQVDGSEDAGAKATATGLDVDSAQIVNLALNLSESRRAARRNVSSPLPHVAGFAESLAGGSLRHHLQQQRRVSRNVSPKPDRGDRAATASPRVASGQRISSSMKPAFESEQDGQYQYHFSASTLARAEKAKNAIELMAHYRRLLQYVPPLKPQALERSTTAGSAIPESPLASRTISTAAAAPRQLGRQYNPLQYIRNRKVRARERRGIDGEAQGFGDIGKVSYWVDQVIQEASSEDYQAADCLILPSFSQAADITASPHNSPPSTLSKTQAAQAKVKRPRIDWITNPADMIADIFWLEQDENKKSIEDRHGRMIFPRSTELKRPISRSEEPETQLTPGPPINREPTKSPDLRIDTRLPEFKSISQEKHADGTASRAKQRIREATRIHHGRNGSARDHHHLLGVRSRSRSDTDSSDSEVAHPRRRRSGTADTHDRGKDILEKQMMEMLANEAHNSNWGPEDIEEKHLIESIESQKPMLKDDLAKSSRNSLGGHSRSGSLANKDSRRGSTRNGSSGRASLEVPGFGPRRSFEELDSTAPNSPQTKASKPATSFVPSIGMDISPPPPSRPSSPTRNPLLRVKSRINQLQGHSRDRSRSRVPEVDPLIAGGWKEASPDSPETPEKRKRSMSPVKKITPRKTDDSSKSSIKKTGSIRRGKTSDETSGIRGLFKGSRNPVSRVSDLIWKKDSSPVGPGSGFSTDESDVEDVRTVSDKKDSRNSSIAVHSEEADPASPQKEKPSYLSEMPVFSSPFAERRGRSIKTRSDEVSSTGKEERQAREARRKSSRAHMLDAPPRIDVQNASPTSSPELPPQDRYRRGSSVSDFDSRRGSFSPGVYGADARLNAILGIPGRKGDNLPVTGLFSLETSHNHRPSLEGKRHWSISDRGVSVHRGPMTKREIARVKALLLSSGIKAKEISRRAAEIKDLRSTDEKQYADIASLAQQNLTPVPKSQEHILAARILSDDIQLSSHMWHAAADQFTGVTVQNLLDRIDALQGRLVDNLTPMTRKAADEADEVSKDLVTSQTLKVKRITDTMNKMMRQRRRRFRWLRRGGWVLVEWALVGVMWAVWFVVVFVRVVLGVGRGVMGVGRWLMFR